MKIKLYIFLVYILFSSHVFAGGKIECINKIEPELLHLIDVKFKKFDIPKISELDKQSVGFDMQQGGDGCYVVASGDYDGNQKKDYSILLKSKDSKKVKLIVAMKKGESWEINNLPIFCESINFCYVKTGDIGSYTRSKSIDFPVEGKYERTNLISKNKVVISGTLESTEVVYVKNGKHWNYVWASD